MSNLLILKKNMLKFRICLGKPIVYDLIKSNLSEKSQEYNGYLICPGVGDLKSLNLIGTSAIGQKASTAAVGIEFMYSALWINQLSNQEEIFSRYGIYRNMIKVRHSFK